MGPAVLALLGVALASFVGLPSRASACSCLEMPFETAHDQAAAIFEGRVTAMQEIDGAIHVHFAVTQTWRLAEHEHVEVVTASDGAACGYAFEVNRHYLVYASGIEGDAYRVSLCSRTQPMESADDDRALLGSGVVPVDITDPDPESEPAASTPPPTHAGCASCSTAPARSSLATLAGLALVLAISARRRR
ncbi:MAG: MYXO-CTERM sorting domain-containing protein [Sandaracinus sp.]